MMHETVVIHHTRFLQLRDKVLGGAPVGRRIPDRFLPVAEFRQDIDRAVQDSFVLCGGEVGRLFVRVAMQADFVADVSDLGQLFGEGFDGMGWGAAS